MVILTAVSVFVLGLLFWLISKYTPIKVCPVCAGTSLTWLWLLVAKLAGYEIDILLPAVLMGGSVVGIAYQLEKRLSENKSKVLWKLLFMPIGFLLVFLIADYRWFEAGVAIIVLLATYVIFFWDKFFPKKIDLDGRQKVEALEKKMEECC